MFSLGSVDFQNRKEARSRNQKKKKIFLTIIFSSFLPLLKVAAIPAANVIKQVYCLIYRLYTNLRNLLFKKTNYKIYYGIYLISNTGFNFLINNQSSLLTLSRKAGSFKVSIDLLLTNEYKLSVSST